MTDVVHCVRDRDRMTVYIGRPSIYGNPFTHLDMKNTKAEFQVETRHDAIQQYAFKLWNDIKTAKMSLRAVAALDGEVLGCWCSPEPCHGDVLARMAEWATKQLTHQDPYDFLTERTFECDFCNKVLPISLKRECRTTRPSDPTDMCCVMYGCHLCGNGETPEFWDIWIEGEGRERGFYFLS